jgi:hypothetical protein
MSVIFFARDENAIFVLPHVAGQIAHHADIKAAEVTAYDVGLSPFGYHLEKKPGPSTALGFTR